jgi:thioredoxin-like negative regulator of GroEL
VTRRATPDCRGFGHHDTLLLLAGAALLLCGLWLSHRQAVVVSGNRAPEVVVPAVANAQGALQLGASADDRVTVLEFFASWCKECERTLPRLESQATSAVRWISVSVDESADHAVQAARRWGLSQPVGHDARGEAKRAYGVRAVPTVVVVAPEGRIAATFTGRLSSHDLADAVQHAGRGD